ncbi:putative transport protein YhhT [Austwickia sp. TVS 96-490-7B]|nr:putative transport protein YhhT [Austwickia sp. TVS 96-490-7B]
MTDLPADPTPPPPSAPGRSSAATQPSEAATQPSEAATEKLANSLVLHMPRMFLIGVGGAGLAFCIMFVQNLGGVIAPVFLALNLMVTAHPLHTWMARHGVNRGIASAITGLVVLVVLAAFFAIIGWSLTQLIVSLPSYNRQFEDLGGELSHRMADVGITTEIMARQLQQISPSSVVGLITPVFTNLSTAATVITVMVAVIFFMMMDSASIDYRLDLAQNAHPRLVGAMHAFAEGVRRYWIVSSIFGLISAALDVVALTLIGVPLAMVWGILAFLCNYIPNVGFIISLVPPALLALLALGPGHAVMVIVAYLVMNFVVQSLIMPRFTGQAVGITPTLVFVSLLFWSWVLGVLGALLAVPATLLFKAILVDADPRSRWANALIASDPMTYLDPDEK